MIELNDIFTLLIEVNSTIFIFISDKKILIIKLIQFNLLKK